MKFVTHLTLTDMKPFGKGLGSASPEGGDACCRASDLEELASAMFLVEFGLDLRLPQPSLFPAICLAKLQNSDAASRWVSA